MQIKLDDLAAEINIARHHLIQEALKPLREDILNSAKAQPGVHFPGAAMAFPAPPAMGRRDFIQHALNPCMAGNHGTRQFRAQNE
jgi:hypothetical protein